jgi:hypothetical protein
MKVLVELRAALDGHAGIPQAARLLFRSLRTLPGVEVEGLLQSNSRLIAPGLPADDAGWTEDRRIDRMSRVVVSLQGGGGRRVERMRTMARVALAPIGVLLRTLVGLREPLTRFRSAHFKDFVWRSLFARTLPPEDFELVVGADHRIARVPWVATHMAALLARRFGAAVYPRIDTRGFDVMIAETPYPGRVAKGTALVIRYHDAIPLLMPHTITDKAWHQASHYAALRRNVHDGAWFACVSDATRNDLLTVFPEAAARAITVHNMISPAYFPEESSPARIPEILRSRRNTSAALAGGGEGVLHELRRAGAQVEYLLMVSTIEPRKNHLTLLAAWEQLRIERFPQLQLVIVGALGWDHASIVSKFRPWIGRGGLHVLEDVPAPELRMLYRHARATVCPSFGEGFDFSGVEAMRCGGVVAASDIPVHRDVFDSACEYFSPYDADGMAAAIARVIAPDATARRGELHRDGERVCARYLEGTVLPQWKRLLETVAHGAPASPGALARGVG